MTNVDHPLLRPVTAIAHLADSIHAELVREDVMMALGYAILLLSQARDLATELELEARRLPLPEHERGNPYRDVHHPGSTTQEAIRRLSDKDLLELCRFTNWNHQHSASDPMASWWLSKRMTILVLEVVSRGLDAESWRDGTERE